MVINRRLFLGASAALPLLSMPNIVRAQTRELVVGGPASIAQQYRNGFFAPFEEKHNCKVLYEGTRSLTNLQKLRADRAAPKMSVVFMDDPVLIPAHEEGLLEQITPDRVPNMTRVEAKAVHEDGAWVNHMFPRAAIAFNTDQVKDGISSWKTLWDPQWKGRIIIPSLEMTQGIWTLMAATHLATGLPMDQVLQHVDAGFDYLAQLKPNLMMIYTSTPQALQLLVQGEIAIIGGEVVQETLPRKRDGMPVDLASPSEGSFIMPNGVAVVKNGQNQDLAYALVNEFLTDDSQYKLAETFFADPVVPSAPLPSGFTRATNLHSPDWAYVNAHRQEWLDRWSRTMAG